jgi:predicted negative regulator of RcsB-dependent stress response
MAVYDLEEQDQLDDLRAWWARWRNPIATAIIVASLVVIGYQGWRWWMGKQAEEAAALYNAVTQSARTQDIAKAKDAVTQLTDKYASTGYAPRAAFFLAKMEFDAGDVAGAKTQLQWIVDHASESELQEVARYRLAAVLLNDKQYDEALKMLDAKHGDPYDGLYADLRGDALAASGRTPEARVAYQAALTKLDAKSQYRGYVQVKLDSLGVDPAAAAGASPFGSVPSASVPSASAPSAGAASTAALSTAAPSTAAPPTAAPTVAPAPAVPAPASSPSPAAAPKQ